MRRSVLASFAVLGIAFLSTVPVQANILTVGSYTLANHSDGGAAPPGYGLRLDELFNVTTKHDIFTFNFEAPGSAMFLDYNGTSIHIFGTVFGGMDTGSGYSVNSGLWAVDFTYAVASKAAGDDDLQVLPGSPPNQGSITWLIDQNPANTLFDNDFNANGGIELYDFAGSFPYTFRLGNEDNDLGHRGEPGISGWGWLNHHSPTNHIAASDWLFTVNPIPLPGAHVLAAIGLAGVGFWRSRRKS